MNTNFSVLPGMTAALAGGMVVEAFSGLPFLFSLAIVIASVSLVFGASVVVSSIVSKRREPVRLRNTRRALRATA